MRRARTLAVIVALAICGAAHAQFVENVSKVGTTSACFLEIEVGARPLAMGGAFVATANDATALYWNAAGLARLTRNEVHLGHTEWLADMNYDFAGVALPLGSFGTLGASFCALGMDEMEVRTVFYPEGTGERFGASDVALGLSYARALTDRFSIGFTGKYIQQKIWHMSASSFALDVGTLFVTQLKGMRIGASISNFGGKMRLEGKDTQVNHDIDPSKYGNNDKIIAHLATDRWSLPLIFRAGVAMELLNAAHNRLTLAVDAIHPNDNTEYLNVGAEYAFNENVFLRAGYKSLFLRDGEEGLTLGGGLAYELLGRVRLKLDYAYLDFGVLENVQRFSIGLEF
jgi:opacity protein-like surface antigen